MSSDMLEVVQSEASSRPAKVAAHAVHRILACLGHSAAATNVLEHALALGRVYAAPVTALHVLEPPKRPGFEPPDPMAWQAYRLETDAYLQRLAGPMSGDPSIDLATHVAEGEAATQICRWAEKHDVDLVVFGTHGPKAATPWFLASTARKLLEGLKCSLLILPAASAQRSGAVRYDRILLPLDGSMWSETALAVCTHLARAHGSELVLVHAVPAVELTRVAPLTPEDRDLEKRVLERNERVGRNYLEQLRARVSASGINVRAIIKCDGDVRSELMQLVEREAPDLVVMSSCGSSGHAERACGSVAAHFVERVAKPLLIVRTPHGHPTERPQPEPPAAAPRLPSQASP